MTKNSADTKTRCVNFIPSPETLSRNRQQYRITSRLHRRELKKTVVALHANPNRVELRGNLAEHECPVCRGNRGLLLQNRAHVLGSDHFPPRIAGLLPFQAHGG